MMSIRRLRSRARWIGANRGQYVGAEGQDDLALIDKLKERIKAARPSRRAEEEHAVADGERAHAVVAFVA